MNGITKIALTLFAIAIPVIANSQTDTSMFYRRSSLYSIMLNQGKKYTEEMDEVFYNVPIPEKYNNHNLSVRVVRDLSDIEDKTEHISKFIKDSQIAKRMVSKWFNRDKKEGLFNMDLIAERGYYNATEEDVTFAIQTKRGLSMIADAGEELIGSTFLLVNDITYVDKEAKANQASLIFEMVAQTATIATGVTNSNSKAHKISSATAVSSFLAKGISDNLAGFKVEITSYLFKLDWNDSIANEMYTKYYIDESGYDEEKKKAYVDDSTLFNLKFIGKQNVTGDVTSIRGLKTNEELIRKSLTRAIDKSIVELQKNNECFRVKVPIYKVKGDSIMVKVGLKEGIDRNSKYEVLEARMNKDGKVEYKRIGIIKPVENHIWDNRYMAMEEEAKDADLGYTLFKSMSGKIEEGMLARQIK